MKIPSAGRPAVCPRAAPALVALAADGGKRNRAVVAADGHLRLRGQVRVRAPARSAAARAGSRTAGAAACPALPDE